MAIAANLLQSLVPISQFNKGQAAKIFDEQVYKEAAKRRKNMIYNRVRRKPLLRDYLSSGFKHLPFAFRDIEIIFITGIIRKTSFKRTKNKKT